MNKLFKWILIGGGGLVAVIIAVLLIIPIFVDVQKYKPQIEKQITQVTGRPFSVGDDLTFSLFPWAGVSFSNLKLGNLAGFKEKQFVTIKSFDVRLKLIPLLSGEIEIKRFVVDEPRIVLVKKKDGRVNWAFPQAKGGEAASASPEAPQTPTSEKSAGEFPIKALVVGEFAITNGNVLWSDRAGGMQKEISGITLQLENVSLDRPITIAFSAVVDKQPLSLDGKIGPVGKNLLTGSIPVDLTINALKQLAVDLKGRIDNPAGSPAFDLDIEIDEFSPRKLLAALGPSMPVATTDPKVLNSLAVKCHVKGTPEKVAVSEGRMTLDDSRFDFSVKAGAFSRPDIVFDFSLDQIDLDRYLPPPPPEAEKKQGKGGSAGAAAGEDEKGKTPAGDVKKTMGPQKKTDYTPLRRLVLNGAAKIGKLKVKNARIQDISLKVTGKNGLFNIEPLTMTLYQGNVSVRADLNVQKDVPKTSLSFQVKELQVNPLLKDVLKKDFLEGLTRADVSIRMEGDGPDLIKKTLNGKGNLMFNDGAIVGIDLAGMVRHVKDAFSGEAQSGPKPRTDFAELGVPFTIENGLVRTSKTYMKSPVIRLAAAGKAHLVKETLDFRVEPKFVATIKGQGDAQQHRGFSVPVLISGTFSKPEFQPDLEGILRQNLKSGVPKYEEQKKLLEDTAKGLLKSFKLGN